MKRIITAFSPSYYLTRRRIKETEFMSEGSLRALQFRTLKKVLIHAYRNVPYYRDIVRERGLDPHGFTELSDIRDYPFLDKVSYRHNIDALVVGGAAKALWPTAFTGGTTGAPLKLYRSFSDYGRERAYMEHSYRMVGMDPSARTVHIRGSVDDANGVYYSVGDFGNTLYLSSNNMDDENLRSYIEPMREFQPTLLYTLPSVATVLAQYMVRNNIPAIESIKHAFLPSENLYNFQKSLIEKVFNCKIGTMYGHAEHAVFAARCTESSLYHVLPQYGYVELIDKNGNPVTEEGGRGEIVGTSFTNLVCPLIRYRTGDYAVHTNTKCPCGRNYPMWKEIQGREQSVAIAKNKGKIDIGPELLCTLHDKSYGKIKQFQIRQAKVGELDVYVRTHNERDLGEAVGFFKRFFDEQFPDMFDVNVIPHGSPETLKETEKHLYFTQAIEGAKLEATEAD